jgi:hypothetical protein
MVGPIRLCEGCGVVVKRTNAGPLSNGRPLGPVQKAAGPAFGVRATAAVVHNATEIESAISEMAREGESGLVLPPDNFSYVHRDLMVSLAAAAGAAAVPAVSYIARAQMRKVCDTPRPIL